MKPSVGSIVAVSIRQECSSMKLGNVHPLASFANMSYQTFIDAAMAIGQCVDEISRKAPPNRSSNSCSKNGSEFRDQVRNDTVTLAGNLADQSVGQIVLSCVQAMQQAVGVNTSLGTILLFAPILCSVKNPAKELRTDSVTNKLNAAASKSNSWKSFSQNLEQTLRCMTPMDSRLVYQAIANCAPGGLGDSQQMSVHDTAPENLLSAMQFAASYDDVALQYATNFELVLSIADRLEAIRQKLAQWRQDDVPTSISLVNRVASMPHVEKSNDDLAWAQNLRLQESETYEAICLMQLELLASRPDSLIARKANPEFASRVQNLAEKLYSDLATTNRIVSWMFADSKLDNATQQLIGCHEEMTTDPISRDPRWLEMDAWMRDQKNSTGSQLANPGTIADLLAAAILILNLRRCSFI